MKILVSACLLGDRVRYDGQSKPDQAVSRLAHSHELYRFCPEVSGGLPVPREEAELQGSARAILEENDAKMGAEAGKSNNAQDYRRDLLQGVYSRSGRDVTANFLKGAQDCLLLCQEQGIGVAILKERSPSCGSRQVYDGSFRGRIVPGMGICTALLSQNGIRVFSEENFAELFSEENP